MPVMQSLDCLPISVPFLSLPKADTHRKQANTFCSSATKVDCTNTSVMFQFTFVVVRMGDQSYVLRTGPR